MTIQRYIRTNSTVGTKYMQRYRRTNVISGNVIARLNWLSSIGHGSGISKYNVITEITLYVRTLYPHPTVD